MRVVRRSLLSAALAALTVIGVGGTAWAATPEPAPERFRSAGVEVVAHRGASADAPENTLVAVREAFRQRADVVEVDVQRTADGQLVLMHDRTLQRTTNVEEVFPTRAANPVGTFTLAELRRLDAGSWFSPQFAGERIPTLRELLLQTGPRAGLLLEIKDPALYPGIERDVARQIAYGFLPVPRNVVQSFDRESVRRSAALHPLVPVGQLYGPRPTDAQLDDAARHAAQLTTNFRVMDASLVAAIRARGMSPGVYTVNAEADMQRMIDLGVDRIITDRPAVLRGVLAR